MANTYTTKIAKNGATLYYGVDGKRVAKETALENERNYIIANGTTKERYELAKEEFAVTEYNQIEKRGFHSSVRGSTSKAFTMATKYEWHVISDSSANIDLQRAYNLTVDEFKAEANAEANAEVNTEETVAQTEEITNNNTNATQTEAEEPNNGIGDIFKAAVKTLGEETRESDAKFEIGKTYFVMHFLTHQTDTITVEARTAHMLTGTTSEGTRKYRIFTNVRGEFVQIGKDEDNNGIYIYAKNEFTPANVENAKKAAIETAAQLGISTGEESETKVEETTETLEQKRDRLQAEVNETFRYLHFSDDSKVADKIHNRIMKLICTGKGDSDERKSLEAELEPINKRLGAAEHKYEALTNELATVIAIIAEAEAALEIAVVDMNDAIAAEIYNAEFAALKSLPLDDLTLEYVKACKNEDNHRINIINAVFESHKADDLKACKNDHAWSDDEPEAEAELPKGFIEVATGADAWKAISPYFPNGFNYYPDCNHTIFNNDDAPRDFKNFAATVSANPNGFSVEVYKTNTDGSANTLLTVNVAESFNANENATVLCLPEAEEFVATQITFPNGYEGEPTVEVSRTFDNLDDAARFIAADNPIIGDTLATLKPAYDGYYFGSVYFAGWRITRGGKTLCEVDFLGNTHGDAEIDNLVCKYFNENDQFVIPDVPGFLDPEFQDDYKEFRPKVEIVKAVFKNSEVLNVKEILAPLAEQAQVELGNITLADNFDKSNATFKVNIEVKGSTNEIEKFKALFNSRQPEPPTNSKKFIKAALDTEADRNPKHRGEFVDQYEGEPDDFDAELAKLTAEQSAARKILDEKQAELLNAQDAHQAAQDVWLKANRAVENLYRAKAEELSERLLPLKRGCLEMKTQDGFQPFIYTDTVTISLDKGKFAIHGDCSEKIFFELARYDTPAQVEAAINGLKATDALGGDKFIFPTADELNSEGAIA